MRLLVGLLAGLCWAGCQNPCQSLCTRMTDYAEECGYSVSEADQTACEDAQADPADPSVCRIYGTADQIRDEWTCEDMAVYFE